MKRTTYKRYYLVELEVHTETPANADRLAEYTMNDLIGYGDSWCSNGDGETEIVKLTKQEAP